MSSVIEQYANLASDSLASGISSGATSLTLNSAASFPASAPFRIRIANEIIYVGAISGAVLSSLTRGAEGTSASSYSSGQIVTQVFTAAGVRELMAPVGFPLLTPPPTSGSWTLHNAGSSTLIDNGRSLTLRGAATTGGNNLVAATVAVPSTPYKMAACILPFAVSKQALHYGICLSDGTKYITFLFGATGTNTPILRVTYWTTTGAVSSDDVTLGWIAPPLWFRITDNGSNQGFDVSPDGINWANILTQSSTLHFTATLIGFCAWTQNSATPNIDQIVTLVGWNQS